MRLIDKIANMIEQDGGLIGHLNDGDIVTVSIGKVSYDVHPTFWKAYIDGWEDTASWIRCSGHVTWGDISRPHDPGTAPDTSLHLGDERRAWLQEQGGIQPTIIQLIDEKMKSRS